MVPAQGCERSSERDQPNQECDDARDDAEMLRVTVVSREQRRRIVRSSRQVRDRDAILTMPSKPLVGREPSTPRLRPLMAIARLERSRHHVGRWRIELGGAWELGYDDAKYRDRVVSCSTRWGAPSGACAPPRRGGGGVSWRRGAQRRTVRDRPEVRDRYDGSGVWMSLFF